MNCKQLAKDLVGDKWTLGDLKRLYTEDFWTWDKSDGIDYDKDDYLRLDKFVKFEKELWFELGKAIWRKYWSVFQDHLKYIRNDIVKPLCVGILRYAKRVQDIHDLVKHLTPPLIKGGFYEASNWKFRNKELSIHEV